jgi:class 3 adenylate cyclase
MAPTQRRLSAVLHADLTGFVRLMESDEAGTVERLKAAQIGIFVPAIEQGGGRLVDSAGDSILAEFSSAVAAVTAALDIQQRMAAINDALPEDRRLLFRIGVHLGELIVDEQEQVFGDGVNLAARIQAFAASGGIAVSRAVKDVTELQIDGLFVDAGEQRLKNVGRPVQIYHVRPPDNVLARTTASVVPRTTLRFHGADLGGHPFILDVALDRLIAARSGLAIGRDPDRCELPLVHSTVSRRHARLLFSGEILQIEDLGSTNGTLVNGAAARLGAPVAVRTGDRIRIGEIEFVFRE